VSVNSPTSVVESPTQLRRRQAGYLRGRKSADLRCVECREFGCGQRGKLRSRDRIDVRYVEGAKLRAGQ
jgi:hypothetical protein